MITNAAPREQQRLPARQRRNILVSSGVDAAYEAEFRRLGAGLPMEERKVNAAEVSVVLEANTVKGPDHVASSVSEGRVPNLVVDEAATGTCTPIFVSGMEVRRSPAVEDAGTPANLELQSMSQLQKLLEKDPESLNEGFSASADSSICGSD